MEFNSFGNKQLLVFGERHEFEHMDEIGLPFDKLVHRSRLRSIEWALGTRHPMRTTRPERIRAPSMPKVIIFPALSATSCTIQHSLLVEQHFYGCEILLQVACLRH